MADEVLIWKNVSVDVETARGAEFTIEAVTNAEPAVVSYSGAGAPEEGDYIHITESNGMSRLRDRAFRVSNLDAVAKTFELEDEDSTDYGIFQKGRFAVVEFGASFATIQNVNSSGGEPSDVDITTIHDDEQRSMNGPASALSYTFTNFFKPSDPGYREFRKAGLAGKKRVTLFGFGQGGSKIAVVGYPFASGSPTGQGGQPVMVTCSLKAQGQPSVYSA